jgi:hypothetical protein
VINVAGEGFMMGNNFENLREWRGGWGGYRRWGGWRPVYWGRPRWRFVPIWGGCCCVFPALAIVAAIGTGFVLVGKIVANNSTRNDESQQLPSAQS